MSNFLLTGIGRRRLLDTWLRSVRYCSSPQTAEVAVDKSTLSKLRKKTGFPLLNCKKALEKFDNDIKQVRARQSSRKASFFFFFFSPD